MNKFSIKLFLDYAQQNSSSYLETLEAVKGWAKECNGFTIDEIHSKLSDIKIMNEWVKEEVLNKQK